jgi:LysR family nitrogen assimilation transcriptional regulator
MNLKQLEYFVRVAELGSFSKASAILDIAQPALSRQVRLLETDLRVQLLQRTGRGVVLSEAGKRLYGHSVAILQMVAQAREDLDSKRDEPSGRVVVGLTPSMSRLLTLPLVTQFEEDLPKAYLSIVEGLSTHIAEWIATGRIDIGILLNPDPDPALEIQPVLDEPLCLVSPAAARAARSKARDDAAPLPFAELPRYPLVIPDRSHVIRKMVETQAALAGLKLQIAWEISGVPSILDLVRAGHGHAVLTRGAVLASSYAAAFSVRPLTLPRLVSKLCLATSAHKPTTPLMRRALPMLTRLLLAGVADTDHNKS